jgi:Rieske Fe-S protein
MTTPSSSQNRRSWIKTFVLGSASVVAGGLPGTTPLLAEITPGAAPADIIPLPVSQYPALLNAGGSVRVEFTTDQATYRPILINRGTGNAFYAMDSACKHAGCIVQPSDSGLGRVRCLCHGSRYDIAGRVTQGPALEDLTAFNTSYNATTGVLSIHVPGLNLAIRSVAVQSQQVSGAPRLALKLSGFPFASYRVRYAASPSASTTVVPFATTPTGTANQTSIRLTPATTYSPTLYVDATGTRGFYVIELMLTEY